MIVVFAAMKPELVSLPKKLGLKKKVHPGGISVFGGEGEFILAITGIGRAAKGAAEIIIRHYSPKLALSVGLTGGLVNNFSIGDIVIGRKIFYSHNKSVMCSHVPSSHAFNMGTVRYGNIFTADKVLVQPEKKKQILRKFDVDIVDMESYHIARLAQTADIPFLAVKAISDLSNERIADFNHPLKMVYNPAEWWRLGRSLIHGQQALKSLECFLLPFLEKIK